MLDGIGATELLHIFIFNRREDASPACTGRPIGGYEAKIVDREMRERPRGEPGRLAVRGPTACRYLADARQKSYVEEGWNITDNTFLQDRAGYFYFVAGNDDRIISSGYNIVGPEVEVALLAHPEVVECAVLVTPDKARGHLVKAFVVLEVGVCRDAATGKRLQDHAKASIAPYKYPRAVEFVATLPKTQTDKIQRFRLREGN